MFVYVFGEWIFFDLLVCVGKEVEVLYWMGVVLIYVCCYVLFVFVGIVGEDDLDVFDVVVEFLVVF